MPEFNTHRFMRTVEQAIVDHDMIGPNEAVLIGVSGGPDSMTLLHVLHTLAPGRGWRLGIAHLNHGLRPGAAESDEALVCRTAYALGLPYFMEKADVRAFRKIRGLSIEEAAREIRYRFFARVAVAHGYAAVALGHHADDNAELVLMNLLRGSGTLGLAGIPPSRLFQGYSTPGEKIRLIRPLIGIRREDIRAFLAGNKIPSVTDLTNTDLRYRRNRIRHELMPMLRERYNPDIVDTLNRTATILRSEKEWLDDLVSPVFQAALLNETDREITLSLPRFCRVHPAVQRRIIRMAVQKVKGDLRRVSLGHIDAVMNLARSAAASGSLDLPDRIRVTTGENRLLFNKTTRPLREIPLHADAAGPAHFEYVLEKPGGIYIPELSMDVQADILPVEIRPDLRNAGHQTAFFDMGAVSFPLTIRSVKPGDRFTPLGMAGTQKVSKYFIDHKIPISQRTRYPVLASRGKLVWLMGLRTDESSKITITTRKMLKIAFELA